MRKAKGLPVVRMQREAAVEPRDRAEHPKRQPIAAGEDLCAGEPQHESGADVGEAPNHPVAAIVRSHTSGRWRSVRMAHRGRRSGRSSGAELGWQPEHGQVGTGREAMTPMPSSGATNSCELTQEDPAVLDHQVTVGGKAKPRPIPGMPGRAGSGANIVRRVFGRRSSRARSGRHRTAPRRIGP